MFTLAFLFSLLIPSAHADVVIPLAITPSTINVAISVSQTSCTSPCPVYFNMTGTTSPETQYPFHDIQYKWNFGDDDNAVWTTGAHVGDGSVLEKKNRATGAIAAHIYEIASGVPPTVFTPTVELYDGVNTTNYTLPSITVTHPDTTFSGSNSACFTAGADFTDCPSGATQVTIAPVSKAITAAMASNSRITVPMHGYATGTAVTAENGTGTLPGLNAGQLYYVCSLDADTVWAYDTEANANGCSSPGRQPVSNGSGDLGQFTVGTVNMIFTQYATTGKRLLYRGGETFNTQSALSIAADNVMISKFGSSCPTFSVQVAGEDIPTFNISGVRTNVWIYDVCSVGTDVDGDGPAFRALQNSDGSSFITLLRINATDHGFFYSNAGVTGSTLQYSILQDNTAENCGAFIRLKNGAIMGNSFGPTTVLHCEHSLRIQLNQGVVVSSNTLSEPSSDSGGKHNLTIRAEDHTYAQPNPDPTHDSFYAHVSDNKLIQLTKNNASMLQACTTNISSVDYLYNMVFERNWIIFGTQTVFAINLCGVDYSARNNIIDFSAATPQIAGITVANANGSPIYPTNPGIPQPNNIWMNFNTFYKSDTASANGGTAVSLVPTNSGTPAGTQRIGSTTSQNNLAWFVNGKTHNLDATGACVGGGTCFISGVTTRNNSSCTNTGAPTNNCVGGVLSDPTFIDPTPTNPADFKPNTGSYAIGSGITGVKVFSDFFLNARNPASPDIGAIIH